MHDIRPPAARQTGEHEGRPLITIIGTGPGSLKYLTVEARDALLAAEKIFFRISGYPVYQWLKDLGKHVLCFDVLYSTPLIQDSGVIYKFMADAILREAQLRRNVCYALPGNPGVLEDTTRQLRQRAMQNNIGIKIIPGISFLDLMCAELDVDAVGLQIVLPRTHVEPGLFSTTLGLLVCQLDVNLTQECLLRKYSADHLVTLIWTPGLPDYRLMSKCVKLENLVDEFTSAMYFASLYVPPQ